MMQGMGETEGEACPFEFNFDPAAFKVGEAKSVEEVRARTIELWQKCFDNLRQASEAQIREAKIAVEKWFELMTPPFPTS